MSTEKNLPTNDPDLILAQTIGSIIESDSSFSEINNRLIDQLLVYKKSELSVQKVSSSISDSIWNKIENETKKQSTKITPLFAQPSTFAWASAAVILIAAFFGFYWITLQPQLELVAESGANIELVTLEDGTLVTMRPNSRLHSKSNRKKNRSYALEGEAFFDVATDPSSPFSVDGIEGTVTVLGTRFNLSTWGGKSIVYLEEGKVSLTSNLKDEELILLAGQSSQIQEGSIELLSDAKADQFIDWISSTIIFNGNSPEEVIFELNQHFGVRINLDELQNRAGINGSLQLGSINQTLDDLGLVLGGTFRQVSTNEFEFISME